MRIACLGVLWAAVFSALGVTVVMVFDLISCYRCGY